jgi:hypothetical protein
MIFSENISNFNNFSENIYKFSIIFSDNLSNLYKFSMIFSEYI